MRGYRTGYPQFHSHPYRYALRGIGEQQDQSATSKQQAYIQSLLRDFPGAKELLEDRKSVV